MTVRSRGRTRSPRNRVKLRRKRTAASNNLIPKVTDSEYRVGPGCPPREYQFKKGQSGNPKGAKRKTSLAPDLKAHLERALSGKVMLQDGEKARLISKAAAGIEQLVDQFAQGDRHARRDLIDIAHKLGVDLTAGQGAAVDKALQSMVTADDEAALADYLKRHGQIEPPDPSPTPSSEPSHEEGDKHDSSD
jgi:hypothetical protein